MSERVARVEGANGTTGSRRSGWKSWLPVGAPVATLIVVLVTVAIHFDNKIGSTQKDVQGISGRLGKVEDAVKVLTNQQSDQTQKLIHDLLAAAKTATRPEFAIRAAQVAATLTATLKEDKRPATPDFFKMTVKDINELSQRREPAVRTVAFAAQQQLAEYRSALIPIPPGYGEITFKPMEHAFRIFPGSGIVGGNFDATTVSGSLIEAGKGQSPYPLPFVQDALVKGGRQTLDGVYWKHVIFVGTDIDYKGGEMRLENVVFINCTFNLPKNERAAKIAEYVTLSLPALTIGPAHS